jgi:hypothetical protein
MDGPKKGQIFRDEAGNYWRQKGSGYEEIQLMEDEAKQRWLMVDGAPIPEPAGPTKANAAVKQKAVPKQKTPEELLSDEQSVLAEKIGALNKKYEGRRTLLQQDIEKGKKKEWESKSGVRQLFSDPKRLGSDIMQKKRPSLGGVSFDDVLVSDDPEFGKNVGKAAAKSTILGTQAQFARTVPKSVARTLGNLGGAVVGGAARIPEWMEKWLGDSAPTDEKRKEHYDNARGLLDFAKEASSTGDRWAEGIDKWLPGKELGESSPISGLAEGAGNAAPTLALLLATKGSDPSSRAMIARLLTAEGAATGFNEATKAEADPGTAFKTGLGMGGLRAIQNRLPVSNMFRNRVVGTTVETPFDVAATNLLMHHATKSATGKDKMSFDDWTQGMVENWLQNYGMGKLVHDAAGDVDLSRVKTLAEQGHTPGDPLRENLIPDVINPVKERRWFEGLRKKPNEGRKDLAVQNLIQQGKGQNQVDTISSANWAAQFADLGKKDIIKARNWISAAQTNFDIDPNWQPGMAEPVGGMRMPKVSPEVMDAVNKRLEYNKYAVDDYNKLLKARGLPALQNPNPFYDPHVYIKPKNYNGGPLDELMPPAPLQTESNREKSRVFYVAVDPVKGGRTFVAKTDNGYVPVTRDPATGVVSYGKPIDVTGMKIASPIAGEIKRNTGMKINPQTFNNIATARVDVRRAARNQALAGLLRGDADLTNKTGEPGFRTPNLMTNDSTLNDLLYSNPNAGDRMKFRNDISNVLEHFYGDKKFQEPSKSANATQAMMDWYQRLTLANPLVHGPNVGEHALKQLGASDLMGGDPAEIVQLMKTAQSLRDTNDPVFQLFMATGGKALTLPRVAAQSRNALGGKNITPEGRWALEDPAGQLGGLEGKLANLSDKVIWGPDANARFAFWLKNVQAGADPHQAHLDIARTQPNYNIPVNLFNEGAGGGVKGTANDLWRVLSQQGNRSPNTAAALRLVAPMFQRYRHNSITSTVNTAKDLTSFTKEGALKGLDKAGVLAILNSGLYPALGEGLDQVFGDEDKHYAFPKPGSSHYIKLLSDWKKGALGTAELADRIYTPPPAARVLYGAATGKDPMSGRSVEGELPGFAAESILPHGFSLSTLLKNSGSAGQEFGMDDVTRMLKPLLATQLLGRSDRTDAEKVASYLVGKQVKPREQLGSLADDVKQDQAWQAFTQALREGNKGDIDEVAESGDLSVSSKAINNATRKTYSTRPEELAMKIAPLSAAEAVEIFDEMTDDEKVAAYGTIAAKLSTGKTKNEILRGQHLLARVIRETAAATGRLSLSPYASKNPPMRRHVDALEALGRNE